MQAYIISCDLFTGYISGLATANVSVYSDIPIC